MSVNTTVYIGPFLVCKMKVVDVVEQLHVCTKNKRHDVDGRHKFCPHCGSKVEEVDVVQKQPHSFTTIQYQAAEDLTADQQLLVAKFQQLAGDCIGYEGDDNTEILVCETTGVYDADHEQIHFFPQEQMRNFANGPSQEDIDLLKRTLNYERIEVEYGILIHVA